MKGCAMKRIIFLFAVIAFGACATAPCAQTLKAVKDRGSLVCGVSQGLPGFSNPDDKGNWTGFDVDFCRAIAAALLNDAGKVKFTPLSAKDRFEPLKTGDIDLLSRNTTWTLSRDVAYGNFARASTSCCVTADRCRRNTTWTLSRDVAYGNFAGV